MHYFGAWPIVLREPKPAKNQAKNQPLVGRTSSPSLDQQGVRKRLDAIIAEQFGDRRNRRVQLAVARAVRRAGIKKPDTFYKKLVGRLRIAAADVPRFARVFGVTPVWLVTGEGPSRESDWAPLYFDIKARGPEERPDGRPAPDGLFVDPAAHDGLVAAKWVGAYREGVDPRTLDPRTGKPRRGRPAKHPSAPPFGPRVAGHVTPPRSIPDPLKPKEIRQRMYSAVQTEGVAVARELWDGLFDAELLRQEPRLAALTCLLELAQWLETNVGTNQRHRTSVAKAAVEALKNGQLKWRKADIRWAASSGT